MLEDLEKFWNCVIKNRVFLYIVSIMATDGIFVCNISFIKHWLGIYAVKKWNTKSDLRDLEKLSNSITNNRIFLNFINITAIKVIPLVAYVIYKTLGIDICYDKIKY